MRQHHFAGERAFVGVLGASNYTYVEATWTQSLPDWIASHTRMLAFFGGVPGQLVSENLKAGVTRACFYERKVNRGLLKKWSLAGGISDLALSHDKEKHDGEQGVRQLFRFIVVAVRRDWI